jgi:hypothetical protein
MTYKSILAKKQPRQVILRAFTKKLNRWKIATTTIDTYNLIKYVGSILPKDFPLPVLSSLWKTWFRAWTTAGRFQGNQACPMCLKNHNNINHIIRCPVSKALAEHHYHIDHVYCSDATSNLDIVRYYAVLDTRTRDNSDLIPRLFHIHTLHLTINHLKHNFGDPRKTYRAFVLAVNNRHPIVRDLMTDNSVLPGPAIVVDLT